MTVATALQAVAASGDDRYGVLLQHGTLEIGFYAPEAVDPQTPHDRDEVYVVHSGSGTFVLGDDEQPFAAGDVLFVAAGSPHRFKDFSDDFGTWVIFMGRPV
jgi:mannose-6-phosphate isomerase-like protein (cupin superfamily)